MGRMAHACQRVAGASASWQLYICMQLLCQYAAGSIQPAALPCFPCLQAAQQPAITRAHTTSVPEPAKGTNWAGVAAASVAVVGLSAGLYLASQDSFRPRSAVLPPKVHAWAVHCMR